MDKVSALIEKWQNSTGDSRPFGLRNDQIVQLAELAIAAQNPPREWGGDDEIPDDVDTLHDQRSLVWSREHDGDDDGLDRWCTSVSSGQLLFLFGTMTEGLPIESAAPPKTPLVRQSDIPDDDWAVTTALSNALRVLDHIADRKGSTVSVRDYRVCLAAAKDCRAALRALPDVAPW